MAPFVYHVAALNNILVKTDTNVSAAKMFYTSLSPGLNCYRQTTNN